MLNTEKFKGERRKEKTLVNRLKSASVNSITIPTMLQNKGRIIIYR